MRKSQKNRPLRVGRFQSAKDRRVRGLCVERLAQFLLRDLHLHESRNPEIGDSTQTVQKLSLSRAFLKKYKDSPNPEATQRAIDLFLEINRHCRDFRLEGQKWIDSYIIDLVRDSVVWFLSDSDRSSIGLFEISEGFMVGPGASLGARREDFYTKVFDSPLTCTDASLFPVYRSSIQSPSWRAGEESRRAKYGDRLVEGSRLSTVPKNVDIDRVICTEPILNMIFQKGIGSALESRLKTRLGIDLSNQPEINSALALQGSIDQSFGTIDLKSASDCMSLSLCRSLLPSSFLKWLELTRSGFTTLPDGRSIELHMVSSMGNAFTFPLQTMLFGLIVKTCYSLLDLPFRGFGKASERTFGVFGDDIVVLSQAYNLVTHALRLFGFFVNDGKSFNSGSFRESCGSDFWDGVPVRGVYIQSLKTQADVFSSINRLVRWSAKTGISLDFTLCYLRGFVPFLPVPNQVGDTNGIKVSSQKWQNQYFSIWTRSPLFRGLIEKTRVVQVFSEPTEKSGSAELLDNSYGALSSFIGGFIRDGTIGLRSFEGHKSFLVRQLSVPNWDFMPPGYACRADDWKVVCDRYVDISIGPRG